MVILMASILLIAPAQIGGLVGVFGVRNLTFRGQLQARLYILTLFLVLFTIVAGFALEGIRHKLQRREAELIVAGRFTAGWKGYLPLFAAFALAMSAGLFLPKAVFREVPDLLRGLGWLSGMVSTLGGTLVGFLVFLLVLAVALLLYLTRKFVVGRQRQRIALAIRH
jgi:hypothetical protein